MFLRWLQLIWVCLPLNIHVHVHVHDVHVGVCVCVCVCVTLVRDYRYLLECNFKYMKEFIKLLLVF